MLERHEVEAFLTLAEELHFGRTAERLGVSTARISQTIGKLERRVGVPLFTRTSRRVELTPVGRELHDGLRPAWTGVTAAFQRAVDAGRGLSGTLTAAFTGAAAGQLLTGAVMHRPGLDVRIREARLTDVVPWLLGGEVDVVLTDLVVGTPGLVTGPVLVREARMLAVPAAHPLAHRDFVSQDDLVDVVPPAATITEALTLVGAGRGVLPVGAHVRRYHARPDVVFVPFTDAPVVEWALVWHADRATALVREFGRAVREWVDHPG